MKKIVLKLGEAWLKPWNVTWSYLCSFTQEKTPLTQPRSFLAGTSLLLLLNTIDTSGSSLFNIVFFKQQNKTNEFYKTEEKKFYCTHCPVNAWSNLISLIFYSQLLCYYATFVTRRRRSSSFRGL